MLTKQGGQMETVWDALFPDLLRSLPEDLAGLDQLLAAPGMLKPFAEHWGKANLHVGRPSLPMATYVRLMVLKHRQGWGYERLVRQVADSFQLRRFCRIAVTEALPDESTVRKLTRRLGPALVAELTREVVRLGVKERAFKVRALRCDSTVQDSDIRHPTDSGLAADAVRVLARVARKVHAAIPGLIRKVRNRSRAARKRIRELNRSLARRTGDAPQAVQRLTQAVAQLATASLGQARRLLTEAKAAMTSRGPSSPRRATRALAELEQVTQLTGKVVEQIRQRFAGEKIVDRVVSIFDADARPIRKGKKPNPNQFGHVIQYTELTSNTRGRARGLLLPPTSALGNPPEVALLPATVAEVIALELRPAEAVFDRGFTTKATQVAMTQLGSKIFIAGSRQNDGSKRTRRRLASYRVGCEGRISHLKREYGGRRSRLKGFVGAKIWAGWAALAYNLDTVARLPIKAPAPPLNSGN